MSTSHLFGIVTLARNTDSVEIFSQVNFVNTTNTQVLQPTGTVGGGGAASIPTGSGIYGPSVDENGNTRPEYLPGGAYGLTGCNPVGGGGTNSQAFPVSPALAALLASRGPNLTTNSANTVVTYDPYTTQPVIVEDMDSNWTLGGTFARAIENTTNLYQILTGLRGRLPFADWTWEAYGSHGSTRTELDYNGFVSTARWQALAASPNFGRGYNVTGSGQSASTYTSGLPVFESFAISRTASTQ